MRAAIPLSLVVAGLLLTGCSTAAVPQKSAEAVTQPSSAAPSTAAATANPDVSSVQSEDPASSRPGASPATTATTQQWADEKMAMWVENSGIKSVKGFLPPCNLINSWKVNEPGNITVCLENSYRFNSDGMFQSYQTAEDELRVMGLVMFESIGESSPELGAVTFTTEDGSKSGTYSRARTGADPADLESWAEEKYVQWLDSMNDTYESFCGKNIKKLEDYRSCIPTDPHAYIASVEAPARGELLVTLADGKWQNNTYDTARIPGVDFVSGNMILNTNKKAHSSEAVEKLTVKTENGKESSTGTREQWTQ